MTGNIVNNQTISISSATGYTGFSFAMDVVGNVGGSIINNGTISGATAGIGEDSTVAGSITNTGAIDTAGIGIFVLAQSSEASILNSGSIVESAGGSAKP